MGKRIEDGFSWGPGNIPGRRIALQPGDSIAVYNSTTPHILASELGKIQPFVSPPAWRQEAEEFVASLKKPKKPIPEKGVVFEINKAEMLHDALVEVK